MNGEPTYPSQEYDLKWSSSSEKMVRHILQQGETRLAAQAQLALAADQRATTSASVFVGFAAAIFAATIAYASTTGADESVIYSALAVAASLLLGSSFCFYAARPRDFYSPGANPEEWFPVRDQDFIIALGGAAENHAEDIDHNRTVLEENGRNYALGVIIAAASPIVGLLVWLTLSCLASTCLA